MTNRAAVSVCTICDGVGLVRVMNEAGQWVSQACECQEVVREERRLAAARVPERYRHCSLDTYETDFNGANASLSMARRTAQKFAEGYPVETAGNGLLFVGTAGLGKTHLAVGILTRLVRDRGVRGLFCDYRELLRDIQNSYNPSVQSTEVQVLKPILAAEVLVLDDLGAQRSSDWVQDMVALIINARYNDKLTTIITTNWADLPAAGNVLTEAQRAAREQTLGDRIGDRMRSRLAEMCVRVQMTGQDFRQTVKNARFG